MTITLTKVRKTTLDTSFVSEEAVEFYHRLRREGYGIVSAQCKTDDYFEYPEGTMASFNGKKGAIAKEARKNTHFSVIETKEEKTQRDLDDGWAIPLKFVDENGKEYTEAFYPEY
jgi:hypothetical protein